MDFYIYCHKSGQGTFLHSEKGEAANLLGLKSNISSPRRKQEAFLIRYTFIKSKKSPLWPFYANSDFFLTRRELNGLEGLYLRMKAPS